MKNCVHFSRSLYLFLCSLFPAIMIVSLVHPIIFRLRRKNAAGSGQIILHLRSMSATGSGQIILRLRRVNTAGSGSGQIILRLRHKSRAAPAIRADPNIVNSPVPGPPVCGRAAPEVLATTMVVLSSASVTLE